jgi:hypothetical protein
MDISLKQLKEKMDWVTMQGGITFVKFTCLHCGSRQTSVEPDVIHESYTCCKCGKVSYPHGYGMLVILPTKELKKNIEKSGRVFL